MILTSEAIESLKNYVSKIISYASYETSSGEEKIPIHRKERLSTGEIAVFFTINSNGGKTKITKVKVYDMDGKVFASKYVNIDIESPQEGILYRFVFDFKEEGSEE